MSDIGGDPVVAQSVANHFVEFGPRSWRADLQQIDQFGSVLVSIGRIMTDRPLASMPIMSGVQVPRRVAANASGVDKPCAINVVWVGLVLSCHNETPLLRSPLTVDAQLGRLSGPRAQVAARMDLPFVANCVDVSPVSENVLRGSGHASLHDLGPNVAVGLVKCDHCGGDRRGRRSRSGREA